ncbi:type II CRISPR-associated endonuclease Cas1 [Methanobrevibacter sp.]|uniref:type II CRISPR-associated endonuclease Cas1 n=1 Tax=Methanobrevibacter sp. TaxID=66852 RepID=UPI003870BD0D
MSWRTVVISNRAKLDLQMNYMVIRMDTVTKIHLSEISVLLIESTAVSITTSLLAELTKKKIKVIFCDEKRMPSSQLVAFYGSHDTSQKYKKQIVWSEEMKKLVWSEIVAEKIRKQAEFLRDIGKTESELLQHYIEEIKPGDESNREGHAAKVYFNTLFGMDFSRTLECNINAALNYGYSIILSTFAKEVVAQGYFTQLGVFHDNMFNEFNLACDLMEPFRILVDRKVASMNLVEFESKEKRELVDILNQTVYIDGNTEYVSKAIRIYSKSVFDALNDGDLSIIKFYRNEL